MQVKMRPKRVILSLTGLHLASCEVGQERRFDYRPTTSGVLQALLDERVQICCLPVAAAATRVLQHAPNDAVGATTVFSDLFEIAG